MKIPSLSPLLFAIACFTVLFFADRAHAQYGNVPRYEPATPTLSPYLNLLRNNGGVLPNYYSFVRPAERAEQAARRNNLLFNRQQAEIEQVRSELGQGQVAPTGSAGWFNVRGTQGFQNTGHYYSRSLNQR